MNSSTAAGLEEQSRYKLLRSFFPMSLCDFRALERQVAASVGETCKVFVPLPGEGTAVWQPVSALRVGPGLFRLLGPMPESECREFGPAMPQSEC